MGETVAGAIADFIKGSDSSDSDEKSESGSDSDGKVEATTNADAVEESADPVADDIIQISEEAKKMAETAASQKSGDSDTSSEAGNDDDAKSVKSSVSSEKIEATVLPSDTAKQALHDAIQEDTPIENTENKTVEES